MFHRPCRLQRSFLDTASRGALGFLKGDQRKRREIIQLLVRVGRHFPDVHVAGDLIPGKFGELGLHRRLLLLFHVLIPDRDTRRRRGQQRQGREHQKNGRPVHGGILAG